MDLSVEQLIDMALEESKTYTPAAEKTASAEPVQAPVVEEDAFSKIASELEAAADEVDSLEKKASEERKANFEAQALEFAKIAMLTHAAREYYGIEKKSGIVSGIKAIGRGLTRAGGATTRGVGNAVGTVAPGVGSKIVGKGMAMKGVADAMKRRAVGRSAINKSIKKQVAKGNTKNVERLKGMRSGDDIRLQSIGANKMHQQKVKSQAAAQKAEAKMPGTPSKAQGVDASGKAPAGGKAPKEDKRTSWQKFENWGAGGRAGGKRKFSEGWKKDRAGTVVRGAGTLWAADTASDVAKNVTAPSQTTVKNVGPQYSG